MENNSGTNTTLLVIILVIIVGVGVWWFTSHKKPADDGGLNIELKMPAGDSSGSTSGTN